MLGREQGPPWADAFGFGWITAAVGRAGACPDCAATGRFSRHTPGKHVLSVHRAYAANTEPKSGLLLKFQLHVQGWSQALALTVPPLPPSVRKRGVAFTQLMPRIALAPA